MSCIHVYPQAIDIDLRSRLSSFAAGPRMTTVPIHQFHCFILLYYKVQNYSIIYNCMHMYNVMYLHVYTCICNCMYVHGFCTPYLSADIRSYTFIPNLFMYILYAVGTLDTGMGFGNEKSWLPIHNLSSVCNKIRVMVKWSLSISQSVAIS